MYTYLWIHVWICIYVYIFTHVHIQDVGMVLVVLISPGTMLMGQCHTPSQYPQRATQFRQSYLLSKSLLSEASGAWGPKEIPIDEV